MKVVNDAKRDLESDDSSEIFEKNISEIAKVLSGKIKLSEQEIIDYLGISGEEADTCFKKWQSGFYPSFAFETNASMEPILSENEVFKISDLLNIEDPHELFCQRGNPQVFNRCEVAGIRARYLVFRALNGARNAHNMIREEFIENLISDLVHCNVDIPPVFIINLPLKLREFLYKERDEHQKLLEIQSTTEYHEQRAKVVERILSQIEEEVDGQYSDSHPSFREKVDDQITEGMVRTAERVKKASEGKELGKFIEGKNLDNIYGVVDEILGVDEFPQLFM